MLLKRANSISQASAMCFFMLNVLHILSISHILLTIDKILVAHQAPSNGGASLKTVRKDHRQYPNTLKHEVEPKHLAKTFTSGKEKQQGPTEPSQPTSQGQKSGTSRLNFIFFPNRTDYHSSIQGNSEILSLFPSLRTVGGEKVTPRAYNT